MRDEVRHWNDAALGKKQQDQLEVNSGPSASEKNTTSYGTSDPSWPDGAMVRASPGDIAQVQAATVFPEAVEFENQIAQLAVIDRLAADENDQTNPLPFALRVLVAAAVNPLVDAPACIILPDVEGVAEVVAAIAALIMLRDDWHQLEEKFIKEVLRPGLRVRSLRDGKIIAFCGLTNGFAQLHYVDAEGSKTNASLFVQKNVLFGLEPTQRKRPILKSGEKPEPPFLTPFDAVARTTTFGNSGMMRNRVVLLGQRQRFEDALREAALILAHAPKGRKIRAFGKFVWGYIDETRKAVVTHPNEALGEPLVAVTQDALLLDGTEAKGNETRKILVSNRFDLVWRHLEIVQRFAGRNRVLVLAPAERRAEAWKLRESGWSVWEPRGWELHIADRDRPLRGLPGMSQSLRSLSVDLQESTFTTVSVRSRELQLAFANVSAIGDALPAEEAEFDQRLDEVRQASLDLFFLAASLLQAPDQGERARLNERSTVLKSHRRHVELCLGAAITERTDKLLECVNELVTGLGEGQKTPKGEALLSFAQRASPHTHAFVADFGRDRAGFTRFLEANGQPGFLSLTVQGLREVRRPSRLAAFGLMRRDAFAQLIDPWPASEIAFIGYDFEIEKYETRLRQRNRLRDRLGLNDGPRSRVTGLPSGAFGHRNSDGDGLPKEPSGTGGIDEDVRSGFDRLVGTRRSKVHRPIVHPKVGEDAVQARYMTFCGTSWAAFTEEHEVLTVRGIGGARSTVVEMEVPELAAGNRLLIRESGDKDVIREMAERDIGEREYVALRDRAALWKRAIRRSNLSVHEIRSKLANVGINRSFATIRGWLKSESRIGPRSKTDVLGIAEAFPIEGAGERRWDDCAEAIAEVRGLHLSAGAKLTHILATQCENVLVDAAEHEQRVELDFGAVWIVEIAEIDEGLSEWPVSSVNRLNWIQRPISDSNALDLEGIL
jgi:hypothetical protein